MRTFGLLLLIATVWCQRLVADDASAMAERIRSDVKYLSSDRLEGRGVGTRGEELTVEYISGVFRKAGLQPAGERGSFYQNVPLLRVVTEPTTTLSAVRGEHIINFRLEEEFAGQSRSQKPEEDFDAEVVFVGHGIVAPEFGWNDYEGIDVRGKVVVLFTNEPPSDDPKFFGGRALTYYGRWTFKFEEAARRGAKAALIIHTPETAGYPYSVVKPLDGAQLKQNSDSLQLAFAGWMSSQAGEKLLNLAGKTVEQALKEADTQGFRAYSLGARMRGQIRTRLEPIQSRNVIGIVEGSDPVLKSEAVIFTAHWDHLGVGKPVLGDAIYNGAADNATGTALLLEIARQWSAMQPRPKRSAVFLATTAEEKGLLGAMYYAQHPVIPLGKTAMNLNFDMILPLGEPESIVVSGAERTTAWPMVQSVARDMNLTIEPDRRAHLGLYYRSDHFALAKGGVPAFSVSIGEGVKGKPRDLFQRKYQDFVDRIYHSPQDEFQEDWDFRGFVTLVRFAMAVGRGAAEANDLPTWNPGDEFLPARKQSGVK
jgi:Zn-dependent M28 family amino/carboxypeptidase